MYHHKLMAGLALTAIMAAAPLALGVDGQIVGPSAAHAQAQRGPQGGVSIDLFYTELADYGDWVSNSQYDYVWVPTKVDSEWTPYTNGHWVNTDQYGWFFESDEPFGWAVYHYGRWGYDDQLGWFWVPGTQWAPAWVSWRRDERVVGWAPLPPEGRGIQTSIRVTVRDIPQRNWVFIDSNEFLAPRLRVVVHYGDRSPDYYRRTRPVGPVVVKNNIVVNNVINVNFIQQATGKRVETRRIEKVNDPSRVRDRRDNGASGTLQIFAAPVQARPNVKPKKVEEVRSVVEEKKKAPPPPADMKNANTNGGQNDRDRAGAGGNNQPGANTATAPNDRRPDGNNNDNRPGQNNADRGSGAPGSNANTPNNRRDDNNNNNASRTTPQGGNTASTPNKDDTNRPGTNANRPGTTPPSGNAAKTPNSNERRDNADRTPSGGNNNATGGNQNERRPGTPPANSNADRGSSSGSGTPSANTNERRQGNPSGNADRGGNNAERGAQGGNTANAPQNRSSGSQGAQQGRGNQPSATEGNRGGQNANRGGNNNDNKRECTDEMKAKKQC
jgi:hypothetical protein